MDENYILIESLTKELSQLRTLQKKLLESLSDAPEGSLNILKRKGKEIGYYWYQGQRKRTYIARKNEQFAKKLAQKEYDAKLLNFIEKRIQYLQALLEEYAESQENIFNNLQESKKKLVNPVTISDEEYIERWYKKYSGSQNSYPFQDDIYSDRGEHVRSKSEKILADSFYKYNIPYVYEPKLYLDNGRYFYPDFLLLNVKKRKTIVYEHFGLMSDASYAEETCQKITQYENNNFFPGDNFLFTMESQNTPLNTRLMEQMIKKYLK